jgi:hypothetical protein
LNERAPFYWSDAVLALEDLGIPKEQITVLFPPSKNSIDTNADFLNSKIEDIKTNKPLVILSHSKGAGEAFAFAWKYPKYFKEKVKALFLIQGAFGGSAIADHLHSGALKVDSRMPLLNRLSLRTQFLVESLILQEFMNGLKDLTTNEALKKQEEYKRTMTKSREEISDRILYVTSSMKNKDQSLYICNSGLYLDIYCGDNDGLVTVQNQTLNFIGKTIGHLTADHVDFAIPWPISSRGFSFRSAFVHSILSVMKE